MIKLIACIGKNNELGYQNKLIWHLKDDMNFFKETTTNHIVVMGRKTYESIGRKLPNRENIIISKQNIDDIKVIKDPNEIYKIKEDVFIIGGESIYNLFIDKADEIYLTKIDDSAKADTYFPKFDENKYDKSILKEGFQDNIKYTINLYKRKY